jgi:hypothetical protein
VIEITVDRDVDSRYGSISHLAREVKQCWFRTNRPELQGDSRTKLRKTFLPKGNIARSAIELPRSNVCDRSALAPFYEGNCIDTREDMQI